MNATALNETIALGALTGMRSMAGPSALASRYDGVLGRLLPVLAFGEMIADKTSAVGNRTDPVPLMGRAVIGAVVGGVIAHERHRNLIVHGLIGAAAAVAAAHLAYQVRKRLPLSNVMGGVLEDSLVIGIASMYGADIGREDY
jgi:uncharacterized membrane protein